MWPNLNLILNRSGIIVGIATHYSIAIGKIKFRIFGGFRQLPGFQNILREIKGPTKRRSNSKSFVWQVSGFLKEGIWPSLHVALVEKL